MPRPYRPLLARWGLAIEGDTRNFLWVRLIDRVVLPNSDIARGVVVRLSPFQHWYRTALLGFAGTHNVHTLFLPHGRRHLFRYFGTNLT